MPEKTALPLSVKKEDLENTINSALDAKGWEEFKIESALLTYTPYWIFNYNAFTEEGEKGESVSETHAGRAALNASTGELEEGVAEAVEGNKREAAKTAEGIVVEKGRIKEEEARKLSVLKLASQLGVKKENLIISAMEFVQVPFWHLTLTFNSNSAELLVNASNAEILNEDTIPEKGKGWGEAARETFTDLKQPKSWLTYSADIARTLFSSRARFLVFSILKNRKVQMLILAIILIYFLLQII